MTKPSYSPTQTLLIVIASFIAASIVNIYPMSVDVARLRPMALIMVLVFWLVFKPAYVGVIIAFIVGLSADLLLDTRLGQQAFCAVIMAFCIRLIGRYFKELNLATAWLVAASALSIFQICLWLVQYMTQNIFYTDGVYGLLISICTWPLVYLALARFSR